MNSRCFLDRRVDHVRNVPILRELIRLMLEHIQKKPLQLCFVFIFSWLQNKGAHARNDLVKLVQLGFRIRAGIKNVGTRSLTHRIVVSVHLEKISTLISGRRFGFLLLQISPSTSSNFRNAARTTSLALL